MKNHHAFIIAAALTIIASLCMAQTDEPMPTKVIPSFEYFDLNGNGTIDLKELSFLAHMQWDSDSNQFLADDERSKGMRIWQQALTENIGAISDESRSANFSAPLEYSTIFSLWDRNLDGTIDRNEAITALEKINRQSSRSLPEGTAWESLGD